jgi:predicted nucleic acid-binding protein
MQVLLDTNVVLDLFLAREAFVDDAALLWQAHEQNRLTAYVSGITPVNLFYIGRKLKGREVAEQAVKHLLGTLLIAPVNQIVLKNSLSLGFKDFEDAVQHASATVSGLEAIITRNTDDFAKATLPVFAPDVFIKTYQDIFQGLTT